MTTPCAKVGPVSGGPGAQQSVGDLLVVELDALLVAGLRAVADPGCLTRVRRVVAPVELEEVVLEVECPSHSSRSVRRSGGSDGT